MVLHRMKLKEADPLDVLEDEGDVLPEEDLKEGCLASMQARLLPLACLGASHTTLPDKVSAIIHMLKLESGDALPHYLRSIVSTTTDQGLRLKLRRPLLL